MKTGIKITNKKFIVNNNAVVCIIEMYTNLALMQLPNFVEVREKDLFVTAKGIAKCSKNDKFDEVFGKKLALSRAKQKALKKVIDIYREQRKTLIKQDSIYQEVERNTFCRITEEIEKTRKLLEES